MEILLSIIIPTYNLNEYADRLLDILDKQINEQVEVILVDDGSDVPYTSKYKWVKIIRLSENSGAAGKPRNVGLDNAKGKYIAFIDVDDLVSDDYIQEVLKNLKTDIIFISWKSKVHDIHIEYNPPYWNCAVWCRIYRKRIIGNIRFREDMKIAEDWVFNQQIKYRTSRAITKQIYYYTIREGSLVRSNT